MRTLPVSSISEVKDLEGRAVLHERVLLPVSNEGTVTQVMASLKSIRPKASSRTRCF